MTAHAQPQPSRKLTDCSHDYLVERLHEGEKLVSDLIQVLAQFHPYLGPAINEIVTASNIRCEAMEKRHPPSGLILPPH